MKTVFSKTETVAQVWAKQEQPYGNNSNRSLYFEKDTIYSYGPHHPIARFARGLNGEDIVLISTCPSTPTTQRHSQRVMRALDDNPIRKIYAGDILDSAAYPLAGTPTHLRNLADMEQRFNIRYRVYRNTRKGSLLSFRAENIHAIAKATRDYCEVMMIPAPTWALLPAGLEGDALRAALQIHINSERVQN